MSIINDLKNIISHTSECSDETEKSKFVTKTGWNSYSLWFGCRFSFDGCVLSYSVFLYNIVSKLGG
jgi:hypothetical protein